MHGKQQGGSARAELEDILGIAHQKASWLRRALKWLIGLTVVLLVAGGGYYFLANGGKSASVTYRTDPASLGNITVLVTATGTVQPTNQVDVSSELSGIVHDVNVDYNSRVKVGEVLAELNTDKLNATVESSRAHLTAAKAKVAEAEATVVQTQQDYLRQQRLAERNVKSTQELEIAKAIYDRALAARDSTRADVEAAAADLRLDETNLQKSRIVSPIDGVVLMRNVDPGQVVAASLQAPVLFTIAEDLTKMEVQVDVDEADVGKVREGQPAVFSVDAYPERKFEATIKQLRFGSQVVQGVVTYKAVLTSDNPHLLLRPGMTATAEITVEKVKNALTVSNEALRFTPPQTETVSDNRSFLMRLIPTRPRFRAPSSNQQTGPDRKVWVLRDGKAVPVKVKIGASDGKRTQIDGGALKDGDAVIIDASTGAS